MRSIVAIALAVLVLAGCTWVRPAAPAELVAAANAYAAEIAALPGVQDASTEVREIDPKDRPGEWSVSLRVTATSAVEFEALPAEIAAVKAPSGVLNRVTVTFPAGPSAATVVLSDLAQAMVARAALLRALPFAVSVSVGEFGSQVVLAEGTTFGDAAAAVRESGALSPDPVDAVRLAASSSEFSVEVSLAGPSSALLDLLQRFAGDESVTSITSTEPTVQSSRPRVNVRADRPDEVAAALAALDGDESEGRPRTAFSVQGPDYSSVRGIVGLPLGSPEPDDLAAGGPSPTPVEPATLEQLTQDVTAFLAEAATASGVPGAPDVYAVECESQPGASRIEGHMLLDVFASADTADPAYDAITSSWQKKGYTQSDQALGTSVYSPLRTQPVMQATIRGTSEGIRVTAQSECVG